MVLKKIKLCVLVVQVKHGMKYKSMHDFEIRNSKFDGVLKFGSNYVHRTDYTAVFSSRYMRSIVSGRNPSTKFSTAVGMPRHLPKFSTFCKNLKMARSKLDPI